MKAAPKKDRKEYNEAQELENLQRVFDRLDKKGDKKVSLLGLSSQCVLLNDAPCLMIRMDPIRHVTARLLGPV